MEASKTITIYDIPVEPTDKLAELETMEMNPQPPSSQVPKEIQYIESSIPSILLKNIIFNCIPIEAGNSSGGKSWSTQVQFPVPVLTFVSGRGFVVRAPGDTIHLIGIMFDSTRSYLQIPYVFYTWRNSSIQDQALSGVLTLRSLAARYKIPKVARVANFFSHDIVFSHQASSDQECQPLDKKTMVLRFTSDNDAINKITLIQQFLLGRQLHYGLSLTRTMASLSNIVKSRISFTSKRDSKNLLLPPSDAIQSIVLGLLGSTHTKTSAARAKSIIYSSELDATYVSILTKKISPENVSSQKKMMEDVRKRKNIANGRLAASIKFQLARTWRDAISRREFQKSVDEIGKNELAVIDATYAREVARSDAMVGNKCPHLNHYKKVMSSRATAFDVARWHKLRELLDIPKLTAATVAELPKFDTMIACNDCKFAALCPHNLIMFEYVSKFFSGDDSKALIWVADNFTSTSGSSDGRYCRICGELLMRISVESETWLNLSKSSDPEPTDQLGILISDEVAETLNMNLDLSHSSVNRSNIISSIASSIDPWIRRYDLKLRRVKTNSELDIVLSLGLIVAIYAMMSIAHIIALAGTSGSGIAIKSIVTRGEKDLKLLHTLFNGVYKLLTVQRSAVIEKIIAFTPDRIKKIMTRAYGQISGAPVVIETVTVEYHMDLVTDNPYYQLLAYLWRMGELLAAPMARDLVPATKTSTKSVIGVEVTELNKMRNFFTHVKIAPAWKPAAETNVAHPWIEYCWKAYHAYASRLVDGTSALDETNAPGILAEYNKFMELRSSLVYSKTLVKDPRAKFVYCRRNLGRSVVMRHGAVEFAIPEDLTRVFCRDTGKLHEWKLFMFSNQTGAVSEVKSSDFKSIGNPGRFQTLKCVNCGNLTCGTKIQSALATSQTSSASPDKKSSQTTSGADAIKRQSKNRGFFSYYKVRCPESWFHTYSDGKCTKCGIKTKMSSDESVAYIEKYMTKYESRNSVIQTKTSSQIAEDERARRDPGMVHPRKISKTLFKPWITQNTSITEVSKMWSQLPYNLLINIGLVSGTHWQPILAGKINPSNSAKDEQFYKQAATVSGYISLLAISHNRFSVCATRGMHPDLNEFCERRGDEVRELKMLDLGEFYAERQWREENDKPNGFANWCINQFCNLLLKINSTGAVAKRFVEIMVDTIATSEMNMSKSLVYKNIMIAAAKSSANLDNLGDEIDAPETDVEAKEFIKSIARDGESFSAGDMDIDDVAASRGDDDI